MKRGTEAWRRVLETETRAPSELPNEAAVRLPCLTVIHHPDTSQVGRRAVLPHPRDGRDFVLSRVEPIFGAGGGAGPLADPFLSRRPIVIRGAGESLSIDAGGTSTRLEIGGERVLETSVQIGALEAGVVLTLGARIVLVLHLSSPLPAEKGEDYGLIGEAMASVRLEIGRLADLSAPVLVRGESGTGKELVARALHDAGPRRGGPFVAVNMAAVPPSLAAAELFGATKGAFTGADRTRRGHFERADGGTLFLDEIGDTPAEVQPLLLRALETGEVQPVGGERTIRPDVRVVAATDLDLEAAVEQGRFRSPLLHRLQALSLRLPPLRERRCDIGPLLLHFLRRELRDAGAADRLELVRPDSTPWLPASLLTHLALAEWPGNVRQLRNTARRLVAAARHEASVPAEVWQPILAELEPRERESLQETQMAIPRAGKSASESPRKPAAISDEEIFDTLSRHRFRVKPAAEELGISRPSLYERMDAHPRLRRARDLDAGELEAAHRELGGELEALVDHFAVSADALRRRLRELGLET